MNRKLGKTVMTEYWLLRVENETQLNFSFLALNQNQTHTWTFFHTKFRCSQRIQATGNYKTIWRVFHWRLYANRLKTIQWVLWCRPRQKKIWTCFADFSSADYKRFTHNLSIQSPENLISSIKILVRICVAWQKMACFFILERKETIVFIFRFHFYV